MDQVGLVVAGQHVHHDVDADAEGELALARLAGRQRQQWLAVIANSPGTGEIVGCDEDLRDAVAGARGPRFLLLGRRGYRLDPERAAGETSFGRPVSEANASRVSKMIEPPCFM